jgi:hypothetical protein
MDTETFSKQVTPGMRLIDYRSMLIVFDNSNEFKEDFEVNIKPKLDLLKTNYKHFSMVRSLSYIFPLATKIARSIQSILERKGIFVPSVEEVDFDEFSREILRRYLKES